MTRLQVGRVVRFVESGRKERLLWMPSSRDGYFCIDIDAESAAPLLRPREELETLLSDDLLEPHEDPWLQPLTESLLSDAVRRKRDKAWAMIAPLVEAQPMAFDAAYRTEIIARIVATGTASRQSVHRAIRRYWQRGMTPNALLPDYANSGGRGKSRAPTSRKRGRPVKTGLPGLNVDAALRKKMRDAVTHYYAVNRQIDMAGCHQQLIEDHFTDYVVDPATGAQTPITREPYPTLGQFRYWFEKDNDVFDVERRRRTPRVYDKDMRATLGTSTADVVGPGSRWQIDATIADVYVVSRLNRSKIVGRPVLYLVIDVFSRMIVGLSASFEGPSWVGAMMALVNAASDKVQFCEDHGVKIQPQDWPCAGIPSAILGDRGEMLSAQADTLVNHFGVRIENTPPYRADLKGIVEKRFNLIQADFRPYVPGFVEPDFRERGARDYRLDGTLTIDEFTAVIINCVLNHNNSRRFNDYPRDAQMIADDVQPIPVELWEWGIARRSGSLKRYPEDMLRLCLLPEAQASVTEAGIHFYGCYYSSADAMSARWFERARQRGRWKVPVSYDPRCMDTLWVHGNGGTPSFTPCALTDRSSMYRGRSLWEIDQIRTDQKAANARHDPKRRAALVDRNRRIRAVVETAENATRAERDPDASAASRLRDIRNNRAEEREALRKEQAVRPAAAPSHESDSASVVSFNRAASSDIYEEPSVADFEDDLLSDDDNDV